MSKLHVISFFFPTTEILDNWQIGSSRKSKPKKKGYHNKNSLTSFSLICSTIINRVFQYHRQPKTTNSTWTCINVIFKKKKKYFSFQKQISILMSITLFHQFTADKRSNFLQYTGKRERKNPKKIKFHKNKKK